MIPWKSSLWDSSFATKPKNHKTPYTSKQAKNKDQRRQKSRERGTQNRNQRRQKSKEIKQKPKTRRQKTKKEEPINPRRQKTERFGFVVFAENQRAWVCWRSCGIWVCEIYKKQKDLGLLFLGLWDLCCCVSAMLVSIWNSSVWLSSMKLDSYWLDFKEQNRL